MAKGIIVVDVPKNCFQCEFKKRPSVSFTGDMICIVTGKSIYPNHPQNVNGDKPDWCPIRPIPEKMDVREETVSIGGVFFAGKGNGME